MRMLISHLRKKLVEEVEDWSILLREACQWGVIAHATKGFFSILGLV